MDLTRGIGTYDPERFYRPTIASQAARDWAGRGGRAGEAIVEAIRGPMQDREDEAKKTGSIDAVNALVQKFNNPGDTDFQGLSPAQKSLKLSRLLLRFDPEMAKRYEMQAREIESQRTGIEAQKDLAGMSQASQFERERMQGLTEIEKARLKGMEPGKELSPSDIAAAALNAFRSGNYEQWYNSQPGYVLSQVPNPKMVTPEIIQSMASKDILKGDLMSNEIALSQEKTKQAPMQTRLVSEQVKQAPIETQVKQSQGMEAQYNIGQAQPVKQGEASVSKGLPSWLQAPAKSIESDFMSIAKPLSTSISEADKLISTLGTGDVKGSRAIASVFSFMKALDPTSTVRESEFDSVAGASGAYGRFMNFVGQINSGTTLTSEQSTEMKMLAGIWKEAAQRKLQSASERATYVAEQMGIPSWAVIGQSPGEKKSFTLGKSGKL